MKYKLIFCLLTFLFSLKIFSGDLGNEFELHPIEMQNDGEWIEYCNDYVSLKLPSPPISTFNDEYVNYSSVDASGFPLSLYSLTIFKPYETIDIETFVEKMLFSSKNDKRIVLWSEINEIDNGVMLDLVSHTKNTYLMRKERAFISPTFAYVLSTEFFTICTENHDYFVDSFTPWIF